MLRISIIIICLSTYQINAQSLDTSKIPDLFTHYDIETPGVAIGVISNGELIFNQGFGSANLDYYLPITDTTVFYIGSLGKHFTTAALLQLEQKKLINFDDPVTKYLPNFPEYNYVITIRHLIHHTSGIRGTNSLQLFQGIDSNFEEKFDTEDLVSLVQNQEELNFKPGDEYRYSSGGYAVLAQIVEEVSGDTFRVYMNKNIFEPLGMNRTFVSDDANEIIPNRATSYWPIDNGFERRSLIFSAYGDGGIMTTISDLNKWEKAFNEDILGVKNFSTKMYQKGVLNNGAEIPYALALNIGEYDRKLVITHGGGMLGYRAGLVRFPNDSLTIYVLSNLAYSDPIGIGFQIHDILLSDISENTELEISNDDSEIDHKLDTSEWTGKYYSEEINQWRRITSSNDSIFWDSGNQRWKMYLNPIGDSLFSIGTTAQVQFSMLADKKSISLKQPSISRSFIKFDDTPPNSIEELQEFVGTYYSKELESRYEFIIQDDRFLLQINENKPVELYPNPLDQRINWNSKTKVWIGFAMVSFLKDEKRNIYAIKVGDYRVNGVVFNKQN